MPSAGNWLGSSSRGSHVRPRRSKAEFWTLLWLEGLPGVSLGMIDRPVEEDPASQVLAGPRRLAQTIAFLAALEMLLFAGRPLAHPDWKVSSGTRVLIAESND